MNADTIVSYFNGTGRGQIPTQVLAATTETEFQVNTDTSGTTSIAVLSIPLQADIRGSNSPMGVEANAALLGDGVGRGLMWSNQSRPYFNSGSFEGRPFLIRVSGIATPASNGGNSVDIKLYLGTSKSGTKIADTGAVPEATTTAARAFIMEYQGIWSAASGNLDGQFWFQVAGTSGTTYTTWAAGSAQGSAAAAANLQFCASMTWGNAAGGSTVVSEFSISKI